MEGAKLTDNLNCKISKKEEQILNSFAKFGCIDIYKDHSCKSLVLWYRDGERIEIWAEKKEIGLTDFKSINIEEFKLLNELFKIWGWL